MKPDSFITWLKSAKSDFVLYAVIIVLVNLIGIQSYLRLDLTSRKSYSLSQISRQAVNSLEEPLSVKVFFSPNLPAPYNNVEVYLRDLLGEYDRVGNPRFSYEFFDMEKEENKDVAQDFGVYSVQVQQIKDDKLQVASAYMGLAVSYGDSIEQMNNINYTDGLEYDLTTLMQKMINKSDALSGLTGKVQMTLYRSQALNEFNISGFNQLEQFVYEAYGRVNRENFEKIEYTMVDPINESEIDALAERYGLQRLTWTRNDGTGGTGKGILGIVIEYEDRFSLIPLRISRGLLGGFGIQGLETLDESMTAALESLTSSTTTIAYLTGHGEKALDDQEQGAAVYQSLNADIYQFKEVNLAEEDLPDHVQTLVINGPVAKIDEAELYKIDQFLMRGGSLVVYLDPFQEIMPQQDQGWGGGQPVYIPVSTGLEKLLETYGAKVEGNYVLDTASYVHRQEGAGELPLYYVPVVARENLDQGVSITKNLANVAFLKNGAITLTGEENDRVSKTVLASSSDDSWTVSGQINLSPYGMTPPPDDQLAAYPLAVLLEGQFNSYFSAPVNGEEAGDDGISVKTHLAASTAAGKVFLTGSSALTTPQLLDEEGRSSNAIMTHNILDYMNGNEELNEMRSKGLSFNPLRESGDQLRNFIKYFNMAGIPVLVILAGLLVWQLGARRRMRIQLQFNPKSLQTILEKEGDA